MHSKNENFRKYIIDVGVGNVAAVKRMIEDLDIEVDVVKSPSEILEPVDNICIIIPGVGSWNNFITILKETGWFDYLYQYHLKFRGIIGICLGMQIMFKSSEEGNLNGLGIFDAHLKYAFPSKKINIGWRNVNFITESVFSSSRFYHVHQYSVEDREQNFITGRDDNGCIVSVQKSSIYGFQFHPEKSHFYGKRLFKEVFGQL